MIDKKLLYLLGDNKKYILYTVAWMIVGLFANLTITACICWMIYLVSEYGTYGRDAEYFLFSAVLGIMGMAVRYGASRRVGRLKDILGRNAKKELRQKIYHKIVKLGTSSTEEMSMYSILHNCVD